MVESEVEAAQMFVFENNRGKKPTDLEILKANMMFQIHLQNSENEKEEVIKGIKSRFDGIYKAISAIEAFVTEDEVLTYTLRIYSNKLKINRQQELTNIDRELKDDAISFSDEFTRELEENFINLKRFYANDRENIWAFEELITLRDIGFAIPFILKAYKFNNSHQEKAMLAKSLRDIILRNRLVKSKKELEGRLQKTFEEYTVDNPTVEPIINGIEWMKQGGDGLWWNNWNNERVFESLSNPSNYRPVQKYLLWLYENELRSTKLKGYQKQKLSDIANGVDLEHIAPEKENKNSGSGYEPYDEEMEKQYINSLGNHLLLSSSHNRGIGNISFSLKRESYKESPLYQQREVFEMTENDHFWNKDKIDKRKEKIIQAILGLI